MLKNVGAEITLRYNGFEKTLATGEKVDVRDFDISTGQVKPIKELVPNVEKWFLRKYPGRLEVVPDDDIKKINDDASKEISELKSSIKTLEKQLEAEKKIGEFNGKKISQQAEEIGGFGKKESDYKVQIKDLQEKIKNMEEEHAAHIARIMGGKKG